MNEKLALLATLAVAASGFVGLPFGSRSRAGERLSVAVLTAAAAVGLFAAIRALLGGTPEPWSHAWSIPGGALAIELDAIGGMFLAQIFAIGALCAVYGLGYWPAARHPASAGKVRVFFGLMLGGMALLVLARNAILFLVGWEAMAFAAFFLVTAEHADRSVRDAGYVYIVATRIGTLCLFVMFALLKRTTGSFALWPEALSASGMGTAIFVTGVLGFGLKAGLMPLHVWLPGAHANAPSHVSAVMSGVLIKMGIYGLVRLSGAFERPPVSWGLALLALGVASAVLGVAFALGQHDLKRLLAYHSVENIGIIVMGLGLALVGRVLDRPALAALGLAGALLHTWNHGLFKALLFLGAGSVIHATHTREIDLLGGLSKKMPKTALAFLIGAVAISGLPPLNGFVSELLIYLGMLSATIDGLGAVGLGIAFGVPALAMVGALAVACFVKVFGVVFLGEPRTAAVDAAHESPGSMLAPMAVLALLCIAIGVAPPLVAPVLARATGAPIAELAPLGSIAIANGILLGCLLLVALWLGRSRRRAARTVTWDCGYVAPTPRMQYTASSFAAGLVGLFSFALRPSRHDPELSEPFPKSARFESHVPEVVLDLGIGPAVAWLARQTARLRFLQQGSLQLYLLYVLATLIVLLVVWR